MSNVSFGSKAASFRGDSTMDRRTMMFEKRKTMEARRITKGMKAYTHCSSIGVVLENSWTYNFTNMVKRHTDDQKHVDPAFPFSMEAAAKESYVYKLKGDDDKERFYDPSFKHHQVPL